MCWRLSTKENVAYREALNLANAREVKMLEKLDSSGYRKSVRRNTYCKQTREQNEKLGKTVTED